MNCHCAEIWLLFRAERAVGFLIHWRPPKLLWVVGWFHDPPQRLCGHSQSDPWLHIPACQCWLMDLCMQDWGSNPSFPKTQWMRWGCHLLQFLTQNGHGFTKPGGSTPCPQENHTYNDGILSSVLGEMMSKQSLGVRITGQTCKGDTVQ